MTPIDRVRAALLLIWPDGEKCEHKHAREAFGALGAAEKDLDMERGHNLLLKDDLEKAEKELRDAVSLLREASCAPLGEDLYDRILALVNRNGGM